VARLTVLGLVLLLLGGAGAARAGERAVAPGELRSALAAGAPGDTLRLLPGVHVGPFTVTTRVRIVGSGGAVIDGGGRGAAVTIAADGAELADVVVRGGGADLALDDTAILLDEVHDATVARCRIEARAFGIYVRGGERNHVLHNRIRGDASRARSERGNGIHLWRTVRNEIRGNRVIDVRDGVYLSFAHDNQIRDNRGAGLRYGIHYMYSERNTLVGNRFTGSTGGIALMFSKQNRIEDNRAANNSGFGILCQQLERSLVTRNRVVGNGRGFFIENSAGNRFVANRVEANGVGVFVTAGSEANVFTENRFEGNLVQVFRSHGGRNRWAEGGRGNAWSDYAGFDWNGDGVGELPYRLETAVSALMVERPAARWFLASPVLLLLDWWEAFVIAPDPGFLDPAPLVAPGGSRGPA
jgi:nitrous oxidase accessory protein